MKKSLSFILSLLMIMTTLSAFPIFSLATEFDGELGAIYTPSATTFNYYHNEASQMTLQLYSGDTVSQKYSMSKIPGTDVWTVTVSGNLNLCEYSFNDGTRSYEDPYGKGDCGKYTNEGYRSVVCDPSLYNPSGWDKDKHIYCTESDLLIASTSPSVFSYEESTALGIDEAYEQKYLAFPKTAKATLNGAGKLPVGVNYISKSDIDAVELYGFIWHNAFAPYSNAASDIESAPSAITEAKQMIMSLHQAGVSVILEVSTTTMSPIMQPKFQMDFCKFWAEEYHIDGFRVFGSDTLKMLKTHFQTVNPEIRFFGKEEPDYVSSPAAPWAYNTSKDNEQAYKKLVDGITNRNKINDIVAPDYFEFDTTGIRRKRYYTISAVLGGINTICLGDEFGRAYMAGCPWDRMTQYADLSNYFNGIRTIRKNFSPFYSDTGTFTLLSDKTYSDIFAGVWKNTKKGEWSKLLLLANSDAKKRTYTVNGEWIVLADGNKINTDKGLYTVTDKFTLPANGICIAVIPVEDNELKIDGTSITTVSDISKKTLKVTWGVVKKATDYEIAYRKAGTKAWTSVRTSNKTTYTIKNLVSGGAYEFRVRAIGKKNGKTAVSKWSNTSRRYLYKAVVNKLVLGKKQVTVQWKKDKNASYYEVMYSTDKTLKKNVKKVKVAKKNTKVTIKKLTKGKTYYIRVRCVKTVNKVNYVGEWSAKKNIKIK